MPALATERRMASATKRRACSTADTSVSPFARPAVIADARAQPVPCRGPASMRTASSQCSETLPPSRSASRSRGAPSRCPPLMSAALAPRFETSAQAAASTPSSVETSQPVSELASTRLGVTSVACPIRSWRTPHARRSSSGVPSLAASTGSITSGGRALRVAIQLAQAELDVAGHVVGRQHPELDGIRTQVAQQDAELCEHDVRKRRQHLVHLGGILHGQRGDHARAVHTKGAKDLEIRLQPGAAGRIRAGDAEGDPQMHRGSILIHGSSLMQGRVSRLLAHAAALLACLAAAPTAGLAETPSSVILISLDGTRPADVESADLTTFAELRRRGARASRLVPVFPTNTFPNHVTLVTGVYPDVHGIANNDFVDPERGEFHKSDDPTWLLAEPLWSLVAQHGVTSASFHWVGSEGPWSSGRGPRYWKPFAESVPAKVKLEQVLAWLAGPEPRPRLVTVWLRGADGDAHRDGMQSPAVRNALLAQDRALGRLVAGLDARGAFAHTTLLIVSDHGMAPVRRRIDLVAALRSAGVKGEVFGAGGMATIQVEKGKGQGFVERAVSVARGLGLEAWPRDGTPRELHARHPRFGDVVVIAPIGVAIQSARTPPMYGSHGYRPDDSSADSQANPWMGALFLAMGRGAPPGAELGELRSLDVAPTVLRLLGLEVPDSMQGTPIARLIPSVDQEAH